MPAMLRRSWRLLAVAALLGVMLTWPKSAFACSCALPDAPPIAFGRADAVFSGIVLWVNDLNGIPLLRDVGRYWPRLYSLVPSGGRVDLLVLESWKGVTTTSVTLDAGSAWGMCGYSFTLGGQYLIYASRSASGFSTNLCTRTNDLVSATTDLVYLRTLTGLALTSTFPWPLYLCLAFALGVLLFAIWTIRRRAIPPARKSAS